MSARPSNMPRGAWFARRRNRRHLGAAYMTTDRLDKHASKLARTAAHLASRPNPVLAAFIDAGRRGIEPHYIPPLFEQRKEVQP